MISSVPINAAMAWTWNYVQVEGMSAYMLGLGLKITYGECCLVTEQKWLGRGRRFWVNNCCKLDTCLLGTKSRARV